MRLKFCTSKSVHKLVESSWLVRKMRLNVIEKAGLDSLRDKLMLWLKFEVIETQLKKLAQLSSATFDEFEDIELEI